MHVMGSGNTVHMGRSISEDQPPEKLPPEEPLIGAQRNAVITRLVCSFSCCRGRTRRCVQPATHRTWDKYFPNCVPHAGVMYAQNHVFSSVMHQYDVRLPYPDIVYRQ